LPFFSFVCVQQGQEIFSEEKKSVPSSRLLIKYKSSTGDGFRSDIMPFKLTA
jgi:hypothetical protein